MHLTAQQQALAQMTDKHATATQVLAEATQVFGGQTARYAKGTQGQASNLTNAFQNLKEELGTALLPAMDWIIARGATLAKWMAKNKTLVLDLSLAFAGLGAAMGLREVLKAVHTLGSDIRKLFGLAGRLGPAFKGAGELVAKAFEGMQLVAVKAFEGIKLAAQATYALIESNPWIIAATLAIAAIAVIVTHWKQFEEGVIAVWHAITGAAQAAWAWIEGAVTKSVDFIWGKIKWLGDEAKKLLSDSLIGGLIGFGSNLFSGHVGRAFGDLAQGATLGVYQADTGSFGAPLRNVWQSNVTTHHHSGHMQIQSTPVSLRIDGREVANAVIRHTLNRAARGPSNMVGGSLVTGAPGLP